MDSVDSSGFKSVVDACTLCDMCFMTMCPYTPPHEWNVDFPHLMPCATAPPTAARAGAIPPHPVRARRAPTRTAASLARMAPVMNWASAQGNGLTRPLLERRRGRSQGGATAALPPPHPGLDRATKASPAVNRQAPAAGRKVVLYATCFANYNQPEVARGGRARYCAHNGVETAVVYPRCCGMPQLEEGDIERVAVRARGTRRRRSASGSTEATTSSPWWRAARSCSSSNGRLILPDDPAVKRLAEHSHDICEYVDRHRSLGRKLAPGLAPIDGGITLHLPCHERGPE